MTRTALALGIVVVLAGVSQADEASPHRNAISFSVGIATGSEGGGRAGDFRGFENAGRSTGGVLGGTLLRDLSDRVAFEASGAYLDRGGVHGVSAMGQLLVTLMERGTAVPYLSAGGGLYHASSDRVVLTRREITGPRGPGRHPGEQAGSPTTTLQISRSTDPALSLGGGVRLDLGPRFYARPDARFMMVLTDGRNQSFGLFTFNVGWRF